MRLSKKVQLIESFKPAEAAVNVKDSVEVKDATTPRAIKTERETVRTGIVSDVDNIIKGLETLTVQIQEELARVETFMLKESSAMNEASDDSGLKKIMDVAYVGNKLAKMQAKINKMKMNAADLEFAAGSLNSKEQADKKAALMSKKKQLDGQIKELQGMLDDKVKERTTYAQRKVTKTKIEGQIALIKQTSGMSDNPDEQKELKDRMKDLVGRYKEEEEALKQLEDKAQEEGEAQQDTNVEKLEKAKEAKKQIPKENKLALTQADLQIAELELAIAVAGGDRAGVEAAQEKMVKAEEKIKQLEAKSGEEGTSGTSGQDTSGTSGADSTSGQGTSGTSGQETPKDPKVKEHEDKIKEIEDAIEQLKDKKDVKSRNNVGVLQAVLKSEKEKLAKALETTEESLKYVDSVADKFRRLI